MNEIMMLIGLPGSGKSTWANKFVEDHPDYVVHSSDLLREELYGTDYSKADNEKVFNELHRRIRKDLGTKSVIYDATNLVKKRRVAFLKTIPKHVNKKCVLILANFEECISRNQKREKPIPEEAMIRMRKTFSPPAYNEGFDVITVVKTDDKVKSLEEVVMKTKEFDQENSHHKHNLYDHLKLTVNEILEDNKELWVAAALHDIGKLYTKTKTNHKGIEDGNAHYYQHHCVGAYEFLTLCDFEIDNLDSCIYISNLIYYHMHPYVSWRQSEKAKERDRKLIGDKMFNDILTLHEADKSAH